VQIFVHRYTSDRWDKNLSGKNHASPSRNEYHIDHTESEEERNRELDRAFDDVMRDDPEQRNRIHQMVGKLTTGSAAIAERMERSEFLTDLSRETEIGGENYAEEVSAKDKERNNLLDELLADAKKERDARSAPESTWSTAERCMAAAVGLGSLGAGIFMLVRYFLEKSKGKDPSKDPDLMDIPAETLAILETMYAKWASKTPEEFFQNLAVRVRTDKSLSVGDHIYFMDLVIKMTPLLTPFLWDSIADKLKLIDRFSDAWIAAGSVITSNEKAARLYEAAAAEKYNSDPVPTKIMAGVLRLVFARLGFDPKYKET